MAARAHTKPSAITEAAPKKAVRSEWLAAPSSDFEQRARDILEAELGHLGGVAALEWVLWAMEELLEELWHESSDQFVDLLTDLCRHKHAYTRMSIASIPVQLGDNAITLHPPPSVSSVLALLAKDPDKHVRKAARELKRKRSSGSFSETVQSLKSLVEAFLNSSAGVAGQTIGLYNIIEDDIVDRGIIMDEAARVIFQPAADYLGLPVEVLWKSGVEARDKMQAAARTVTGRATAKPRPIEADDIEAKLAAAEAEAAAGGHHRLARSIQHLREERKRLPLPKGGYTNSEDAKAAARFSTNFGNLQQRLKAAGIGPLPPDDRVRTARRLSKAYYRAAEVS